MTKSYLLYQLLLRVMRDYERCRIDLREAGMQLTENHAWLFGCDCTLEQMRYKYRNQEVQVFIELCIKNS